MIPRKPVAKTDDASIQLLEVNLTDSASDRPLSDLKTRAQDTNDSSSRLDVAQSTTSTMDPRFSTSWKDASILADLESAKPRLLSNGKRMKLFWWAVRYFVIFSVVFVIFLVPMIVAGNASDDSENPTPEVIEAQQNQTLIFYLFMWLLVSWVGFTFFDIVGLALPYFVRFVTRYINPAHNRYWRVFKLLRRPICFLFGISVSFIAFAALIYSNPDLAVNIPQPGVDEEDLWDFTIADVLQRLTLWACFYFLEKILIAYIAIHYHYRRSNVAIVRGKQVHNALSILYEASLSVFPENDATFVNEDRLIRNAAYKTTSTRVRLTSYLARLHMDTYQVVSAFGNFISDSPDAHWMRPGSAYAVIERAWADETAATALATRIWVSLVSNGKSGLTKDDVSEVLHPRQAEIAATVFKTLDENETGEISFRDFTGIVKETGASQRKIYRGIVDMDHCLNTFDWLLLIILAFVMLFFIVVRYVPAIKEIQTILSSLAIGLSFAVGRTFNHLLTGIIFVFLDHPFDTGDVVQVSNTGVPSGPAYVVIRQSLLYTVFRRLVDNTDIQLSNDQLALRTIENYTRSGINRQSLSIFIDMRTTFKDLDKLRSLLEEFLAENSSDYVPTSLAYSIISLHELNKMELKLAFTHRNNWSDGKLRAQRSNRFFCALVAACRAIPISAPGGMEPRSGTNGNPFYYAQLTDTMALRENIQKEKDRRAGRKWDYKAPEETTEDDSAPDGEKQETSEVPKDEAVLSPEEEKKMLEKEAMQRLSQLTVGKPRNASSTGVDSVKAVVGLRGRGPR